MAGHPHGGTAPRAVAGAPAFADPGAMAAAYREAAAAGDPCERWFTIGGDSVRVRSPFPAVLERLTRALTHLGRPAGGVPDLTIGVWDSASADTPPPPLPEVGDGQQPGALFYFADERVRAGFQAGTSDTELALHPLRRMLSVLDREAAEGWFWLPDATRMPFWDQAAPIRFLLDWWLRERGVRQLHAGAVGNPDGGVLLVGKSGSGKSTAALACLESDLLYAGDDYVAVGVEGEPYVHSLYSSGKVMPDHVERLPFLLPALSNADRVGEEKAVVYVHEQWPRAITPGFPLAALLAPRVTPGLVRSRLAAITPAEALAALAPSTLFQIHPPSQQSLASMSRLLARVPCYKLELGSDISSIPAAIEELLTR